MRKRFSCKDYKAIRDIGARDSKFNWLPVFTFRQSAPAVLPDHFRIITGNTRAAGSLVSGESSDLMHPKETAERAECLAADFSDGFTGKIISRRDPSMARLNEFRCP